MLQTRLTPQTHRRKAHKSVIDIQSHTSQLTQARYERHTGNRSIPQGHYMGIATCKGGNSGLGAGGAGTVGDANSIMTR